jgi:AraC-like DNA-binding protein
LINQALIKDRIGYSMKRATNRSSSTKRHPRVLIAMAWHEVDHIVGIARYAREKGWILQSVSPGQEHMLKPEEVDGVICQLHPDFPEHTRRVTALRVPKVEMSNYRPRAHLPRVMPDFVKAGRMVANHFLQNKFRNIFFLGDVRETKLKNTYYRGVAGVLAKRAPGVTLQCACWGGPDDDPAGIPGPHSLADVSSAESRRRLIAILRELPTPIAAFCCSIGPAVDLYDVGLELGLSIPGQLAIVTWTHHPAVSELTDISLSSISIDYDRQAYEAAAVLDRMMEGETFGDVVIPVDCSHLEIRDSSNTRAVSDPLVAQAVSYIARHLSDPDLSVKRIVDEIGHSRSLLYGCFHEHMGMSVAAYVKQERLNAAKKLLAETSMQISVVARESGYSSSIILSRTLKRKAGMSPRAYRKKHQAD